MNFRLLPIIIFSCAILLLVKIADILHGSDKFTQAILISDSAAKDEKKEKPEEKKEEEKKEKDEVESEEEKEGEKAENQATKPPPPTKKYIDGEEVNTQEYSKTEVEILQRLAKRREELEIREKQLREQENILALTEQRLDKKIAELKELKAETEAVLAEYNAKDDAKIKSLVKMYENMKPKDAAEIFEKLDNITLLLIINKMKEAKASPILAQMSPQKSKDITVEFAKQRRLPDQTQPN